MKGKGGCCSPFENLKHCCVSKPPLVLFTIGLCILAIAFVSLALYVKDNDDIIDPNFRTVSERFDENLQVEFITLYPDPAMLLPYPSTFQLLEWNQILSKCTIRDSFNDQVTWKRSLLNFSSSCGCWNGGEILYTLLTVLGLGIFSARFD